MKNLEGRNAVVIAGGNGIGRSIAHALADAGVNVVVADIREDDAEIVRDEVKQRGRKALAAKVDVKDLASVTRLADIAYDAFGRIDILVNNAGVAVRPLRAFWDMSYEDLKYQVDTNAWGLLHGLHVFVPRMRESDGEKHIVNTSSAITMINMPGNSLYMMTKCGVDGLSAVLREELQHDNIGVTILYPGLVNTTAPVRSGQLRSDAERAGDASVRSWAQYLEQKGLSGPQEVGAGRGAFHVIGAGETTKVIEPEVVGPMVVAAIRENRLHCLTHPAPREGIMARAEALLAAYKPG